MTIPPHIAAILTSIHIAPPERGKRISLMALDAALRGVTHARQSTIVLELKRARLI